MVNRSLVSAKLTELADRTARVRDKVPSSALVLTQDRDLLDIVSFNLMLAVQCCADIASHLIADEGWPAAGSLAEGFTRLEERGVISVSTGSELRRAVGLRNVVAHGYGRVDPTAVYAGATRGVVDLDTFAREVASWVAARP